MKISGVLWLEDILEKLFRKHKVLLKKAIVKEKTFMPLSVKLKSADI